MKLSVAARSFDKLTCADAYNLTTTFLGQWDIFDDSKRDGLTIERRILATSPDITMPARKTLAVDGGQWLVGSSHMDYFRSAAIRIKHVLQQTEGLASIKTFAEAIAVSTGLQAYAGRSWVKESREEAISSDMLAVYQVFFAEGEAVTAGNLIFLKDRWHLIRAMYTSMGGFLVALSDELPEPVQVSVTFKRRVYVPLTDAYTETTSTVNALRIHWQSHYSYSQEAVDPYAAGDVVLMVRKADVPVVKASDKVTLSGSSYTVASVRDESTCWGLRICRG